MHSFFLILKNPTMIFSFCVFVSGIVSSVESESTIPNDVTINTEDLSPSTIVPTITETSKISILPSVSITTDNPLDEYSTAINSGNSSDKLSTEFPKIISLPLLEIALEKDNLWLTIKALENVIEFTVTVIQSGPVSKIDGNVLSSKHRLLLGLETNPSFIDIILLPFAVQNEEQNGFGSQIADLAWNRVNGKILHDLLPNYKYTASGKNETHYFISFQRNWMTCDTFDIQFGKSMVKIWWLLENSEEKASVNREKQINTDFENASKSNDSLWNELTASNSKQHFNLTVNSTISPNQSSTSLISNGQTAESITIENPVNIEMKSVYDSSNFKGPFNISLFSLLQSSASVYMKVCKDPQDKVYHCTTIQLNSIFTKINTGKLSIWQVSFGQSNELPSFKVYPCKVILDLLHSSNKKSFQALFGSPEMDLNEHSKNHSQKFIFKEYFLFILFLLQCYEFIFELEL